MLLLFRCLLVCFYFQQPDVGLVGLLSFWVGFFFSKRTDSALQVPLQSQVVKLGVCFSSGGGYPLNVFEYPIKKSLLLQSP